MSLRTPYMPNLAIGVYTLAKRPATLEVIPRWSPLVRQKYKHFQILFDLMETVLDSCLYEQDRTALDRPEFRLALSPDP